ncbi:MAG: site-2 protease family protein [Archaeoglobi archaeon]|nr:site-2 protease family protein [Candidatus Mnemosynella sp.]
MELRDTWKFWKIEEAVRGCIEIYDRREDRGALHYFGIPRLSKKEAYEILKSELPEEYDFAIHEIHGSFVISVFSGKHDLKINVILAILTFLSTTFVGSLMFNANPMENPFLLLKGLPFSISLMLILGAHELAHYFASRRNGMRASLPYFIPFPSLIGTMGAVIIHRGMIPNRRALLELGVSGPLAGLIASIIATAVGLNLPFEVPQDSEAVLYLGVPPLFLIISKLVSFQGEVIHPVAFAGWVGMLVTFLNMIPVGQLDGGHVLRAILPKESFEKISILSSNLILIFGILLMILGRNGSLWLIWGLILILFSRRGHPDPVDDEIELDSARKIIGILSFILAFLCFTPVPFETNI